MASTALAPAFDQPRPAPLSRDQVLALADLLLGQQWVPADDQPIAAEQLPAFDLRHVPLVEQRGLKRAPVG